MRERGSRIAGEIMIEYERRKKAEDRKRVSKEKEEQIEVGEEIYILRKGGKSRAKDSWQRGRVVGKYGKLFNVEFECVNGERYRESFSYITVEYKKELREDDNIYKGSKWE